jgi:hypothetical protein
MDLTAYNAIKAADRDIEKKKQISRIRNKGWNTNKKNNLRKENGGDFK